MKKFDEIPEDILPYFLEISERLWSGHAAVMVGAGFSRNVDNPLSKKKFPGWHDLGYVFYEKLYGRPPKNENFLNVLKLADEVEAAFGRNVLDNILQNEIPDKEFQPSPLHIKTLELPWNDVFTTNYDTLLERAALKIVGHRYETIINKEDLVQASKPRIIKLHGSFPSERPLIITAEDYRQYPRKFAPFVNTVQQSLLENTLCLLGFSGDDPNFLQWIGWIRDNLGRENSPKIYLIGVLNLSVGQERLLQERNIIPLDLGKMSFKCHKSGLSFFIDYLIFRGKVKDNFKWPKKELQPSIEDNKDLESQLIAALPILKKERENFPGWLIVPEENREYLKNRFQFIINYFYQIKKIPKPFDIQLLYEFNWRLERCLNPIYSDFIETYEEITSRYNPFSKDEGESEPQPPDLQLTKLWPELLLSMMRFYREDGLQEKWEGINHQVSVIKESIEPHLLARFHYERCIYFMFLLNIPLIRKELKAWPSSSAFPYWETKRAGILAELGDVEEAEAILELSLNSLREYLHLNSVKNDYSVVSQEAYTMQLLRSVKYSIMISRGKEVAQEEFESKFSERWDQLKSFKSNPWEELKFFEMSLANPVENYSTHKEKYGFDFNKKSDTYSLGINPFLLKAYSFLRYIEETGIPTHLPGVSYGKLALRNVIAFLADYFPYLSIATTIRMGGDSDNLEPIFGRKLILNKSQENANKLVVDYLNVLELSLKEIEKGEVLFNHTFGISISTIIPEVLSRLCLKCDYKIKIRLLLFLRSLYESDLKNKFKGVNNLLKRLIDSFSNEELYWLLPTFLEFPILYDLHPHIEKEFSDPFIFLDISPPINGKLKIKPTKIDKIIEEGKFHGSRREIVLFRLKVLFDLNLLSKKQTKEFGKLIWSLTDEKTGMPGGTPFLNFVFLKLPNPAGVSPMLLFEEVLSNAEFPVLKESRSIPITNGNIEIVREILAAENAGFQWGKPKINSLAEKIIEWWDADKNRLKEPRKSKFMSSGPEIRLRLKNLIPLLVKVIAPRFLLLEKANRQNIKRIVHEFKEYNLPFNYLNAAFNKYFIANPDLRKTIFLGILSTSEEEIEDSLKALKIVVKNKENHHGELVNLISECIRDRKEAGLISFLVLMDDIVKAHSDLLNEKILENIETGLIFIKDEVMLFKNDNDRIVSTKMLIKIKAALLTVSLSLYFQKKEAPVPSYINDWKNSCLNKDEFAEVRNVWKNAVGLNEGISY